jgi:hypothetical protein
LEREAADVNVKIKAIHTDNGVFNSQEFWLYTVRIWSKSWLLVRLGLITKMQSLKMQYVPFAIWLEPTWCMRWSGGQSAICWIFGPLPCRTRFGFTIGCHQVHSSPQI